MKKIFVLGVIFVFCYLYFFHAYFVDRSRNQYDQKEYPNLSVENSKFHKKLTVIDLHADQLLWNRDLYQKVNYGHFDWHRAKEGGIDIQILSSVTRVPFGVNYHSNSSDTDMIGVLAFLQHWPVKTWFSEYERANYMLDKLHNYSKSHKIVFIQNPKDLETLPSQDQIGVIFSVEGAHAFEGSIEKFQQLYNKGLRMVGLTHFFDNDVGGSAHGVKKNGLTPFGKKLLSLMEEKGVIIDLAHSSDKVFSEVFQLAKRPFVVSHGGVKGTCNSPRNLSDSQLMMIKKNKGMIGIGFWDEAVCGIGVKYIVDAIEYVVRIIGDDYVGLGSDFDGTVHTPFDSRGVKQITQELLNRGYTVESIRKIMGENALRILKQGLKPRILSASS
jgi:membrane dipeptidase